jgi:hypothetical protein
MYVQVAQIDGVEWPAAETGEGRGACRHLPNADSGDSQEKPEKKQRTNRRVNHVLRPY